MKQICNTLILAGVMASPNLFAAMSVTLYDSSSYSDSVGGGEFRAVGNAALDSQVDWAAYSTKTSGTISGQLYFQTFCTELNETFSPGSQYAVASTGNTAMSDSSKPIPITLGVAYLYSQFAGGGLSGYNYTYGSYRKSSALTLQLAIWALLGENNSRIHPSVTGFAFSDLMAVTGNGPGDIFGSQNDWYAAANGADGVQDMALGSHQDQLIITKPAVVPQGQPAVPEPATILSGALLLLPFGAGMVRILRKSKSEQP